MVDEDAPYHAHIYYSAVERAAAEALRRDFVRLMDAEQDRPVLFVGRMTDAPAGPHPIPQFEIHFHARSLARIVSAIEVSGLRALVHPLTDDDLADHSSLGRWIGEPLALDLSVLDPPGRNQGVARFGEADF